MQFNRLSYRKHVFGFLSTAVEAASLSSQKTAIWLFVAKCAALTFTATRICFGLLATKISIFEAYILKKLRFSFLLRNTLQSAL